MKLYENGNIVREVRTIREAKEIIAGLDESMACVDCDPQEYAVFNNKGKQVYSRPRIRIP